MRWTYIAIIVLFVAATAIFAVQNMEIVTTAFLGGRVRAPLAVQIVVYLLAPQPAVVY